jgi:FixJ family two-component response regulator
MPRIYVVDDDVSVTRGLCRLLRSAGYEPKAYDSGRDFMKDYRADIPGCLVSDVSMPDMTGLELQRWLVLLESPLPVIFLTGHGDIPTSVKAIKDGAVDFLTPSRLGNAKCWSTLCPVNSTSRWLRTWARWKRRSKFIAPE